MARTCNPKDGKAPNCQAARTQAPKPKTQNPGPGPRPLQWAKPAQHSTAPHRTTQHRADTSTHQHQTPTQTHTQGHARVQTLPSPPQNQAQKRATHCSAWSVLPVLYCFVLFCASGPAIFQAKNASSPFPACASSFFFDSKKHARQACYSRGRGRGSAAILRCRTAAAHPPSKPASPSISQPAHQPARPPDSRLAGAVQCLVPCTAALPLRAAGAAAGAGAGAEPAAAEPAFTCARAAPSVLA